MNQPPSLVKQAWPNRSESGCAISLAHKTCRQLRRESTKSPISIPVSPSKCGKVLSMPLSSSELQ